MVTAANPWIPVVHQSGKPVYLEIVDLLAADIASGRLRPEDRLPPQRWLAEKLGLNFSTISRAYGEAQRRGLIDSQVGRGSFVLGGPAAPAALPSLSPPSGPGTVRTAAPADMAMNLPPEPGDPVLLERLRDGFRRLAGGADPYALLRYQDFSGSAEDRAAGAAWLAPVLPGLPAEEVVIAPGAQSGLLAVLTVLARPGDSLCCDQLAYPGLRALAGHLGIRLIGLPADGEGMEPDALAAACREHRPQALYLNPTLHNPTTLVMGEARRRDLAAVARRHAVPIIEDDAYGALLPEAPPPLAALAPEMTFYLAGLAKCLGAGLRLAYLRAPDSRLQGRLVAALRATSLMASPITAALATAWIGDGTAAALLRAVRRECRLRQDLVSGLLPAGSYVSRPEAFHLWIPLPPQWRLVEFVLHLKEQGIGVVAADYFATVPAAPQGVRLCIGGPLSMDQLRRSLAVVAAAVEQSSSSVVPAVV